MTECLFGLQLSGDITIELCLQQQSCGHNVLHINKNTKHMFHIIVKVPGAPADLSLIYICLVIAQLFSCTNPVFRVLLPCTLLFPEQERIGIEVFWHY